MSTMNEEISKPPAYSKVFGVVSIAAWVAMAASGQYFHSHLAAPCTTFQLLNEPVVKPLSLRRKLVPKIFRRNIKPPEMACIDCCESTWDMTACLLPDVRNEGDTHKTCENDTPALWTLLPFKTAVLIAVVSAIFEMYLLFTEGAFLQNATPLTTSIKAMRDILFAALQVFAINATLMATILPEDGMFLDSGLLCGVYFGLAALAPVFYFGEEATTPFYLAVLEGAVVCTVVSHGTVDATTVTADNFSIASLLRGAALLVGNPTPSRSAISTTMYTGSFMCLYLAIAMVGNSDMSFPMLIQNHTLSYNSMVVRAVEVFFGFCFSMSVSRKTWAAFQESLQCSEEDETEEDEEEAEVTFSTILPESFLSMMESTPPLAPTALALTVQDWHLLGFGDDPSVAATSDLEDAVDRITSLFVVRIVALVEGDTHKYSDLSTKTICRSALMNQESWPEAITPEVIAQLRSYIHAIFSGYNDVPYHNFEHAYHVTISVNKLVDMMLTKDYHFKPTYGLRSDPLMHLALLFAALIHDVEHRGIPNRQLSVEEDQLSILYNDLSIAEQRSLYVGFSILAQPEFATLRQVVFPSKESYLRFRKAVINLVLNTDIANPERTQVGKSKWKEAFGESLETVEHKVKAEVRRRVSNEQSKHSGGNGHQRQGRRCSGNAPSSVVVSKRRGSNFSLRSDLSINEEKVDEKQGDSNDSLSGTPDSSDNDDQRADRLDGVIVSGYMLTASPIKKKNSIRLEANSLSELVPPVNSSRRQSSSSLPTSLSNPRRKRLGIRRSMDLSGEALETYSRSTGAPTPDEPDELKATVVMELIMTAADVAHNLQGWQHMEKWSNRLYMELRRAHVAGRGADCKERWYENQIGFLECYLLPLARKLNDTKVFGEHMGPAFANMVLANRDRWQQEGLAVSSKVIAEGSVLYPKPEEDDGGTA